MKLRFTMDPSFSSCGSFHVPRLLSRNDSYSTLVTQGSGHTLEQKRGRDLFCSLPLRIIEQQAACIDAFLRRAHVTHLDMHPTGKNMAIDIHKNISLFDFDIAQIDGKPKCLDSLPHTNSKALLTTLYQGCCLPSSRYGLHAASRYGHSRHECTQAFQKNVSDYEQVYEAASSHAECDGKRTIKTTETFACVTPPRVNSHLIREPSGISRMHLML